MSSTYILPDAHQPLASGVEGLIYVAHSSIGVRGLHNSQCRLLCPDQHSRGELYTSGRISTATTSGVVDITPDAVSHDYLTWYPPRADEEDSTLFLISAAAISILI